MAEQDNKRLYMKRSPEAQSIEKRQLTRIRTGSVRREVVRLKVKKRKRLTRIRTGLVRRYVVRLKV